MLDAKTSVRLAAVTWLTLAPAAAQQEEGAADCFASGSIVGAVLATFFATAAAVGLVAYLLTYLYQRRAGKSAPISTKASKAGRRRGASIKTRIANPLQTKKNE